MLKIRSLKKEEVTVAAALGRRTPELHDHQEPSYLSEETLRAYIESEHDILLALVDGKLLAGFLLCNVHLLAKTAYLQDLVIDTPYRRRGYGRELYARMIEILQEKGCHNIWALVREDNKGMKKFLHQEGLQEGNSFVLFSGEVPE